MKMKVLMISLIALLLVAMSGCTEPAEPEDPVTTANLSVDGVVLENIPEGFEYLGARSLEVEDLKSDYADVSGIVQASEGIYQLDSVDYFITAIELESNDAAEQFTTTYKAGFPDLIVERFVEESFNDHNATLITKYITSNGEQVPRYHYVWTNENFVYLVKGNTDDNTKVLGLAEATGF
ncbi:hypothetical protein LI82_12225 [Methanococcoides methylutens]|uniref:Uncharacterized protein n=1 Tax=Methanococcoides methylutens TaxID=2226 RepID=A0A099SZY8_METMT|nr:hypothetical protein [Methanococcoides methylutens]KGK98457.1 hypothetical protein LI82_12225 [Methanococcoides methylutens]